MARDPRILSFYVQQLQTQQRRRAGWPEPDNYGEIALACLAIVIALSGFLWVYDEVAHRDPLYVPGVTAAARTNRIHSPRFNVREAVAPDMASPAVARANEDVPEPLRVSATTKTEPAPKADVAPVRKPKQHAAKRLPKAAADAYAAEPGFFGGPWRGF